MKTDTNSFNTRILRRSRFLGTHGTFVLFCEDVPVSHSIVGTEPRKDPSGTPLDVLSFAAAELTVIPWWDNPLDGARVSGGAAMILECRNCGTTLELDAAARARILATLKRPAQRHIVECPCGAYQWVLGAGQSVQKPCNAK